MDFSRIDQIVDFPDIVFPEINMDDLQIALEDTLDDTGRELNENIVVKAM